MTARALVLALLALPACAGLNARPPAPEPALAPEHFTLAGASVHVLALAGDVRVEPGTGPDVVVTVTRVGPDAAALVVDRQSAPGGDALRLSAPGRRLRYPGLPGRADSVVFRATSGGLKAGTGGFFGLFASRRAITVTRRPGGAALDAHADLVVAVPPGRRLDLQLGAGHLLLAGIAADVQALVLAGATEATRPAGRIRLTATSGGITVAGGSGSLTLASTAGPIEIEGFQGASLSATTGAGSVAGADVSADSLLLRSGAGVVVFERVRARRLELRSGAGELRLADVAADTLSARAGVGAVTLAGVRAGVADVQARKGSVDLALATVPATLRVRADGAARLAVPPGADADLTLKSDHGRFVIEAPLASRSGSGQHLVGRLGRGGARIDVRAEHDLTLRESPIAAAGAPH